jgi:cytochrome d ubiquinol oxidase subunit II
MLSILWISLIAYATFGGADYGAGFWDLLAFGDDEVRHHELIDEALGPVWESNHVWLIFLVVGLFSAFPTPFSLLVIVLFIPLTLALIGIVLRGAAFIFRTHGLRVGRPSMQIWTRVFSFSSIITPFFLGLSAAAVASGQIRARGVAVQTDLGSSWLTPFALTIGLMAVALCATLAAIFLTVEAANDKDFAMAEAYRQRGLIAGAVTAVLGAVGLILSPFYAPVLWQGMLSHALPLVIATMLIGIGTAVALFYRYYYIARVLIVGETAFLLGSWGVSQIPYLVPPDITVEGGAGATSTLLLLLIGIIIGMIIVIPSMLFLFYIFKLKNNMALFERSTE